MPPQQPPNYYERPQSDEERPLQAFHKFLQASLIETGNPVTSKKEEFVPFEQIEEYFSEEDHLIDVLSAVFPGEDPIPVDDSVVQDYLKTFCILLSIGAARYIRHFSEHNGLSDLRLPYHHDSKPPDFPIAPSRPKLWDDFCEKQWVFCAAEMKYKINDSLEPNRILPIVEREVLGQGGSAVIFKIVLHKSFNKLRDGSSTNSTPDYNDTFVLKTYHKTEAEAYYYNEVEAFRRLRPPKGSSDPNIIHFYGSFVQNGTYNVILDFADRGTLEEYFKTVLPPTSGRDIEHFWASLCGILKALIHIHEGGVSQNTLSGPQIFQGWHQDVKPVNILVKSHGLDSPYDWRFKLSDLGLSHFKRTSPGGSDFDAYGTETYGAPECYRADRFLEEANISVKQNVDIWSFGCILTEAAVWLVHGYTGLEAFRRKREEAVAQIPDMKGGDWFHNGKEVLPIVLKTIDDLGEDFRKSDQVTGAILEKMVKNMLDVPDMRLTAKGLHVQARRILHRPSIIESPVVSSGSTGAQPLPTTTTAAAGTTILGPDSGRLTQNPQTVVPPANQPTATTTSRPSTPNTKSQQVQKTQNGNNTSLPVPTQPKNDRRPSTTSVSGSIRSAKRSASPGHPLTPTISGPRPDPPRRPSKGPSKDLPSLEVSVVERWIQNRRAGRPNDLPGKYLLERLETRDHVFLIDDAASMKAHETEVKRILGILAYLVKDSDPDGLELFFTCSKKKFKEKDPTKLVTGFVANAPRGLTDIRIRLSTIIDNYIKGFDRNWLMKKVKPVRSLNIYVLTDGIWQPDTDLRPPLRRLIAKLNENGQYLVGIQFISFGNDSDALRRLDHLDDNLGLGMDIIDHEKSTGNVWKMLFGSTDPWFDGSKASQATSSSNPTGPSAR